MRSVWLDDTRKPWSLLLSRHKWLIFKWKQWSSGILRKDSNSSQSSPQKSFLQTSLYHNSPVAGPPLRGGDGEPSRERRERRSSVSRSESKIVWKTWENRFCGHELAKNVGKIDLWRFIGKVIEKLTAIQRLCLGIMSLLGSTASAASVSSCRSEALKAGYQSRDDQKAVKSSNAAGAALWRQDVSSSADTTNLPELRVDYSSPNLKYLPLGNNFPKQTFVPHKNSKPVCNKNPVCHSESFRVFFPGTKLPVTGACHSWPWRPPGCEGARSCCAWAWRPWGATMGGTVVRVFVGCSYRGRRFWTWPL